MSLNKFDRDLDLLAELIHKTGHIEGNNTVIQFDHLIEISFETEGIGDSKIQHPWVRGVSVPTIEEYEGQMSGEAVHVEFDRIFPLKFADIKQFRASFAQLDDETVKMLWDEALKGDHFDEDDSDPEPVEEDENNMKNETIDASKIKACPKCGAVNITFNHPSYDGGSYVSCCSCNYAPQEETWADSDWEALKRWNDLPREEAPYKEEEEKEPEGDFAPDCCPIEKMDIHPEDKENAIRARERDMKVYPLFDPRPDEDPKGIVDVPDEVNEKNKTLLLTYGTPSEYGDIYTILLDDPELTKPLKVTIFYAKCAVDAVYYKKSIDKVCVKLHGVKAEDIALNGLNHPDWEAIVKEMWVSVAGRLFQGYCAMKAANNHGEPDIGQNNYLHVETPEIRIKHGDVLTDANGSKWMVNCTDDPVVQFVPLYRVCEQVTQDGNNTSFVRQIVTELPDDEEVRAEGENSAADYDANDLGLITQNAIEEDLAKLKPIVANMLQECIKHAKNQQTNCEVSVDLGGRNSLANKKAEKIEGILKSKGFVEVKWHYGDGTYFKENVHVFFIRWRIPDKTQATLHQ